MTKLCVFQCFWALGACFEVLLALVVMPTLGWQWLLALSTIPLMAFAVITPVSADYTLMIYTNTTVEI
jgi:hypothetical protein